MMTSMTLEDAVKRMFTCATAERCAREEACFVVVTEMKKRLDAEQLQFEVNQNVADQEAAEYVSGYAPDWATMPPHWEVGCLTDWSAA